MKKRFLSAAIFVFIVAIVCLVNVNQSSNTEVGKKVFANGMTQYETSEPNTERALTSIKLTVTCKDGIVTAIAENTFTLFPSTVVVRVYLYSSMTKQSSYDGMTLQSSNYTDDLDMGDSISTSAGINGYARYWQARVYYHAGSGWKEQTSLVYYIEADGMVTAV